MLSRGVGLGVLVLCLVASMASAGAQRDLDRASKRQQVAFVLVTDQGATGLDQARGVIRQTLQQVNRSVLVEFDRSDPLNADLVKKLGLAGVPAPVILVVARNGAVAGGLTAPGATPAMLQNIVPSPKKAEILQALQNGCCVLIVAGREGMSTRSRVMNNCAAACSRMGKKAQVVEIDFDDPAEAAFLAQLRVNPQVTEPMTLAVNAQGQVTASYIGAPDVTSLVQAASRKAGGCCPSTVQGGAASCAPPKK